MRGETLKRGRRRKKATHDALGFSAKPSHCKLPATIHQKPCELPGDTKKQIAESAHRQRLHPLPLQDAKPEGISNTPPHSHATPLPIPERMDCIFPTRAWCAHPRKSSLAPKFQRVPPTATTPPNKTPVHRKRANPYYCNTYSDTQNALHVLRRNVGAPLEEFVRITQAPLKLLAGRKVPRTCPIRITDQWLPTHRNRATLPYQYCTSRADHELDHPDHLVPRLPLSEAAQDLHNTGSTAPT